jgi:hypothetical protein
MPQLIVDYLSSASFFRDEFAAHLYIPVISQVKNDFSVVNLGEYLLSEPRTVGANQKPKDHAHVLPLRPVR